MLIRLVCLLALSSPCLSSPIGQLEKELKKTGLDVDNIHKEFKRNSEVVEQEFAGKEEQANLRFANSTSINGTNEVETEMGSIPVPSSPSFAAYDDGMARNVMLPLSSAAYSDSPQKCLDNKLNGAKVSKQVTIPCDYFKNDTCSGFTFVYDALKVIGMSFRGTSNTEQLVAEATETGFEAKVNFTDGGQVSKYFNDAFMKLWNGGLGSDLKCLVSKHNDHSLWVTGHSLGGALASLAAAHVAANKIVAGNKITLYTMGQPRVGDKKYADVHDTLIKAEYRITHLRDIVPHVPPEVMKYVHHKFEVFYKNDMGPGQNYTVCSAQEDEQCSDQYEFDPSINDHTHYFGVEVSDFGKNGCK